MPVLAYSFHPAKEAMALLSTPPSQYGASPSSPIEYVGVSLLLAMYLYIWMGMRANLVQSVADTVEHSDQSPLFATFSIMESLCNIGFLCLVMFLVLNVVDMIVIDTLWNSDKHDMVQKGRGPKTAKASTNAFSWLFSWRVILAVAVAQGMTAYVCFVVLSRLEAMKQRPTPLQVRETVDGILAFNLVAVVVCIFLQFLFRDQLWRAGA